MPVRATHLPLLLLPMLPAGCRDVKAYDATVEVTRLSVVRRDDAGVPITKDAEVSFFQCPGDQFVVSRGGADFTRCMERYKVGDKIPAKVEQFWSQDGHYDFRIVKLGDCPRPPDPEDEASFAVVQECRDLEVYGAKVGFFCDRVPKRELVQKCPWFRRK